MSRSTPLRAAEAEAVSVCGKILKKGQSTTVASTAIGERERALERRGRITIRPSNKPGQSQIVATLGK